MKKISTLFLIMIGVILSSCGEDEVISTPRQRGYQRIVYPERVMQTFTLSQCNYSFQQPNYVEVTLDPYPTADECWYNVVYKPFGATLHLSYKPVKNREQLFKMLNDSRQMVSKHIMRADQIIENYIHTNDFHGIFYELDGSTATNAQFYVTDSTHHFLRGSLYFNSKTNQDSIAPVLKHLKQDMLQLINTLQWQ
jgi:gliding motility-associated lipoprotein GldD